MAVTYSAGSAVRVGISSRKRRRRFAITTMLKSFRRRSGFDHGFRLLSAESPWSHRPAQMPSRCFLSGNPKRTPDASRRPLRRQRSADRGRALRRDLHRPAD